MIISGLTDIPLVIGAWKKINWMVYLWISLSHAQNVIIFGFFILSFYIGIVGPVRLLYMLIVSFIGFILVQNNAVKKDTDYSEMINLTKNEAWLFKTEIIYQKNVGALLAMNFT